MRDYTNVPLSCAPQMGIKQVDLYLVHMPSLLKDVERDWAAFEKIKEAGLAKSASFVLI